MNNIIKYNKFLCSYLLYFRYLFLKNKIKRTRKANVFMLHIGRVGSTVLADLLNQHSQIKWDGEFYPKQTKKYLKFIYKNPIEFLKIKMSQNLSKFYGFELKSSKNQLFKKTSINLDIDTFIKKIARLNFNHYILIERKNYLKQFISFMFAKQTKIHHTKQKVDKISTIKINFESCELFHHKKSLIEHFEYLDNFYQNTEELLKNKIYLHLTYEDDILPNPQIAYNKICDFLNIKNENPVVNLKRTNPFPLKDVIENYAEVEDYLKGTKYEWMLYE